MASPGLSVGNVSRVTDRGMTQVKPSDFHAINVRVSVYDTSDKRYVIYSVLKQFVINEKITGTRIYRSIKTYYFCKSDTPSALRSP